MAWPSTPLTSYVSNTVPAIKAFDLNAFQMGVNGIINGTYSHKGLVIDGLGGALSTPTSGALTLTQSGSSIATPNPTIPLGSFHQNQLMSCVGYISSAGTIVRGVNIKSASYVMALGYYLVTFNLNLDPGATGTYPVFAMPVVGGASSYYAHCSINPANPSSVNVFISNGAAGGASVTSDFAIFACIG